MGISDNGGSTSEILRVLDGPAIGDIRSRLIRLIKPDPLDIGRTAIQELLGYRLPGHGDENAIKNEWVEIVEGSHRLVTLQRVQKCLGVLEHLYPLAYK